MFTPPLTTMMLHSFWPEFDIATEIDSFKGESEFALRIGEWFRRSQFSSDDMPEIPVIARFAGQRSIPSFFGTDVESEESARLGGSIVSARVRLDQLLKHYLQYHGLDEQQEIFDLGTPIIPAAVTSGLSFRDQCEEWLKNTDQNSPKVHICIIDRGEKSASGPDDFAGNLTHAETSNVKMSDHALYVLYALLERLDSFGGLSDCKIYCSLVRPPARQVGKKCFAHSNSTEMVTALRKARKLLSSVSNPVLLNMSMGTHAGPHNGKSPLETQVQKLMAPSDRFFFASAGNEGLKGVANRVDLGVDEQDTMLLHTGPAQKEELLIEFWWREPPKNGDVQFDVQISEYDAGKKSFVTKFGTPLGISALASASVLTRQTTHKFKNVLCASLFEKKCYSGMSCAALGLSTKPGSGGFPIMQVEITIRSIGNPAAVNSWLVVSDDPGTAFVEGSKSGSVTLPASDLAVVSVGGIHRSNRKLIPWARASRGRASVYTDYTYTPPSQDESQRAPWLASRVELSVTSDMGTSFASPRACADAVKVLLNPKFPNKPTTVEELVARLLTLNAPLAPADWDEREGYGQLG